MIDRFTDKKKSWKHFTSLFLVVCPKCKSQSKVVFKNENSKELNQLFLPRRLICIHCGFTKEWEGNLVNKHIHYDWYFGLPLWLSISCCNEQLSFFNYEHLNYIEHYIHAPLRERTRGKYGWVNQSIVSRLPRWMKSHKNRDRIIHAIDNLKKRAH